MFIVISSRMHSIFSSFIAIHWCISLFDSFNSRFLIPVDLLLHPYRYNCEF